MSSTSAQIQFAAEFVTLLVAAVGLALTGLRPDLARARALLATGFIALGAAAFLHGSLLVSGDPGGSLGLVRLVGGVALAGASMGWSSGARSATLLRLGVAVGLAGAVCELLDAPIPATELVLAVASLLVGAALLATSGRSIATRVAASAAGTLLLVVVVLSVALSAVISSSVQHDEERRLAAQARLQAAAVADTTASVIKAARFVAGDLEGYFRASNPNPLIDLGGQARVAGADQPAVLGRLQALVNLYPVGGFAYVDPTGRTVLATANVERAIVPVLAQTVVGQSLPCGGGGQSSVSTGAGAAWALGFYPECSAGGSQRLGTVISVSPLDAAYLDGLRAVDRQISLALVTPTQVLAVGGAQPTATALTGLAREAVTARQSASRWVGNRFVAVVSLGSGLTAPSLVLSAPTTTLVSTRNQLFRTLFLIALGGTVLALGMAALTGDRITARVRRLTRAAQLISGGNTSVRAGALADDEVGVLGGAFDSMIDSIEEQTAALQSAADDETRLRNRLEAVVAGMSDALVATDAAGRITEFNAAAAALTGMSAEQAQGSRVDTVMTLVGDDAAVLGERLRQPSPTQWTALAVLRRPDADDIPVALSAGALRGSAGELAGAVLVVRDLRSEREFERMKTEFLSRVGHELRTPLTGIMGYADILWRRDVPAARARVWHGEILLAAKRLQRIVEMLEFFASSGAGRVLLRPEPLDVRGLANGVASAWSTRLPDGFHLVRRVARDTPPVLADRRWLALAIDELIDNAVKFSPTGGRIRVEAASSYNGIGECVEISVSDQGKGMSEEEQAVAFGEFVQGDTSDTRSFGGLGLGLALVQRVVDGHGGTVTCRSAPGRGATFVIRLPAATGG